MLLFHKYRILFQKKFNACVTCDKKMSICQNTKRHLQFHETLEQHSLKLRAAMPNPRPTQRFCTVQLRFPLW